MRASPSSPDLIIHGEEEVSPLDHPPAFDGEERDAAVLQAMAVIHTASSAQADMNFDTSRLFSASRPAFTFLFAMMAPIMVLPPLPFVNVPRQ